MKTVFLALATLLGAASFTTSTSNLNLKDALEQRVILGTFTGAVGSTHYLKPLTASLRNLKSYQVSIVIPAGYHFISVDSGVQDIVTTQEQLLVLKPKEEIQINLSGMCIQHHNSAPGADDAFKFGGWANPKLKLLAQYLDENNIQDCKGQQAMWVVSDGESIRNIISLNSDQDRKLADKTAEITGQPKLTDSEYEVLKRDIVAPVYRAELRGKFAFNFNIKVPIHIALFDENGIVLKEIYNQEALPGRQEVTYTFDAAPYQGKTIHAKLMAFDDVLMDRTIVL